MAKLNCRHAIVRSRLSSYAGRELAYAVIATASAVAAYRLTWQIDAQLAEAPAELTQDELLEDEFDDDEP